ncbi:hypothetical protein Tco_0926307 [Tanacetum coccineum]|uniref:Uncharacterized protein n=1 Tax=Tanacetum coccineum TaxID=301880 RepID=A0ABQ5DA87_9ASTR
MLPPSCCNHKLLLLNDYVCRTVLILGAKAWRLKQLTECRSDGPATDQRQVNVIENFNIPWVVDGIDLILLTPGLPIIPLYGECDLTIMKFNHAEVECSSL